MRLTRFSSLTSMFNRIDSLLPASNINVFASGLSEIELSLFGRIPLSKRRAVPLISLVFFFLTYGGGPMCLWPESTVWSGVVLAHCFIGVYQCFDTLLRR